MRRLIVGAAAIVLVAAAAGGASGAVASGPRWVREVGNLRNQSGNGVAIDAAGNAFVAGATEGTFPGSEAPGAGGDDAFLAEYTPKGQRPWTAQFGSAAADGATAVAVDALGNVDVAGWTFGTLPGSPDSNAGDGDVFVSRYTATGTAVWTRELGGPAYELALGVSGDASGNVYVAGSTAEQLPGAPEAFAGGVSDAFVAEYDTDGNLVWVHDLGSSGSEEATAVAATPGGGVDVVGYTDGTLPDSGGSYGLTDGFVAHYDDDGTLAWTNQFGTDSFDVAYGVAVDSGDHAFVTGVTGGSLPGTRAKPQGNDDIFLIELASTGGVMRTIQLGSPAADAAYGVAVGGADDVYVTGFTAGTLPGSLDTPAGDSDAFVARFVPAPGTPRFRELWVHLLGSAATDFANAVATNVRGSTATVTGFASGDLPGSRRSYAGKEDVFVAQYPRTG